MSRIESLRRNQLNARLAAAGRAASRALEHLRARGIDASLIGSLKSGDFGLDSDIDFLVTRCPANLIYAVEAELEDLMGGFQFDVIYLNLVPEDQRKRWLAHAR